MTAPLVCTFGALEVITFVGDEWDDLALENGVPDLTASRVVGRPVWDFIGGAEAQHLWRIIFDRARQGAALRLPYRCDSPARRRFYDMEIVRIGDGAVKCASHLLLEETRPRVALLDLQVPRSNDLLVICSWCKRVQLDRTWVEVEQAVDELHLFDRERLPRLSHGACASCVQNVLR
jgi:hypothetical protein